MARGTCSIDGCAAPHLAQGLCNRHYKQAVRDGSITPGEERRGPRQGLIDEGVHATGSGPCVLIVGPRRPTFQLDGVWMNASRAVWIIAHGDPGSVSVLHTCHRGDEGCIRLGHLYLGTQADNMHDMIDAGRAVRGERHRSAVLTESQVREIRRRHPAEGYEALGKAFGVWPSTIRDIVKFRTWKAVS